MDWLKGMNNVIEYIEENLTRPIKYESLSKIVGCSVYEFSRIFSFMAGMSVSEYIRRRRLSQAVFDIQNGSEKIIDVTLKYCYDSPTAFTRAFKELHGATPVSVRKTNVSLKTYPPITFVLTIKGVNEMKFRIEKMDSFQIMGLAGAIGVDNAGSMWDEYLDAPGSYNERMGNQTGKPSFYCKPFEQVGVYDFQSVDGLTPAIIGAEYKGEIPNVEGLTKGLTIKHIPAATWAVFSEKGSEGFCGGAYARILTEWFPASAYRRDESIPHLEVFPMDTHVNAEYAWEIWLPVKSK